MFEPLAERIRIVLFGDPGVTPWSLGLVRAAAVLALAVLLAYVAVPLLSRALRGRATGARAGTEDRRRESVEAMVRAVRGLVLLLGLFEASRLLPLPARVEPWIEGTFYVFVVLFAARAVVRGARLAGEEYLQRTTEARLRERALREHLPVFTSALTVGVVLFSVILIARFFKQDVSSLLTAFGVGSLAIGLAAQAALGNTIAGFILLIDRPFRPGDRVRLSSGESGVVLEIGIRSTRIELPEGDLLIVPNAELANTRLVNLSLPEAASRVEVKLKVSRASLDEVRRAMLDAAAAEPSVVRGEGGAGADEVVVLAVEGALVELALRVRAPAEARGGVAERLRGAIVARLSAEQLAPPPGAK